MNKPILILVSLLSSVAIVACGDSQPAPEVRDASPQTPATQTPPPAKVADAKKPESKKPETKQAEATSPDAKQPDTTQAASTPPDPAKPEATAKSTRPKKKKLPVAPVVDPEPEPVVATAPVSDVPPELQKYAAMAATPKFREFTALAAERHTLQLRASQLRLEMRGVVATDAQRDAVASVQQAIGRVGDRMDSYVSGKTWTQDELITMDFIVSEQMRLRPPPG